MTTEPVTKNCPFCAEEIKAEAIKCRFCGEMLNGSAPHAAPAAQAVYETRVFVIPFPEGSPPTQYTWWPEDDHPFSDNYLHSIRMFDKKTWKDGRQGFTGGITSTWLAYKGHFLDRINELGREGWQLAEAFEHPVNSNGWLARPVDRFEIEEVEVQRLLGTAKWSRLAGARFLMSRMTVGGSADPAKPQKHSGEETDKRGEAS